MVAFSLAGYAQEYKIQKVTVDDFKKEKYVNDTLASAVVIYDIGNTYYEVAGGNYQLVTITKTRIKIINKDGYDFATVKVPLYQDRSTREFLTVSNAFTYNLVNGEVEKTKLKGDGEFMENIVGNHFLATFTMPNVKEGSIIEYTTKVKSPYFTSVPEWYFQLRIPVLYSEYSFKFPHSLIFLKYIKGRSNINETTVGEEHIYKATNIPALRDEGFVANINNYRSSVIHSFIGYKDSRGSKRMIAGTWADLDKTITESEKFGKQLKKVSSFKEIATPIIVGKSTDEEKADAIYKYVQQNFNTNQNIGIYTSQDLKDTYKSKTGNSADLNLLTIALMKSVNIKAYPIILSTRSHGIVYFPSINAFNNVIIGVEILGKTYHYDASNKYASKDILPIHNLNWMGRLIRDDGTSKDILIEPKIKSRFGVSANLKVNLTNNSIDGKFRRSFNNYEAFIVRNRYENLSNDKIVKKIEETYESEIENYTVNNLNDLAENVEESFTTTKESSFDVIGNKVYLKPLHIFGVQENPFKEEERNYPIDFIYPQTNAYTVTYEIPEGYEVDFLPAIKKFVTGSNSISASWYVIKDEKQIKVKFNLDYNIAFIESKEYYDIKKIFDEVIKFKDERIVLKKI